MVTMINVQRTMLVALPALAILSAGSWTAELRASPVSRHRQTVGDWRQRSMPTGSQACGVAGSRFVAAMPSTLMASLAAA